MWATGPAYCGVMPPPHAVEVMRGIAAGKVLVYHQYFAAAG